MAYQVEYFIETSPADAHEWLTPLGWWGTCESPDELPWGEFEWKGVALLAEVSSTACHFRLPTVIYSFLTKDPRTIDLIDRLETWLLQSLPDKRAIRIDEFLRREWETQTGRSWHTWVDPLDALSEWLCGSRIDERSYRFLNA